MDYVYSNIVFILDVSKSMNTKDIEILNINNNLDNQEFNNLNNKKTSRLDFSKYLIKDIVNSNKNNKHSLVIFA